METKFQYVIVKDGLDAYPDLKVLRSVFIPKNKKLLLNSELSEMQRAFQFGKELGFNHLKLKERANTSSVRRPNSFQEVLNHSKAIYFSTALLLNRERLIAHLKHFFCSTHMGATSFFEHYVPICCFARNVLSSLDESFASIF
ncbi:MAG: ImmA/IrrE family metallo-endopeptidase [Saprospiraceae bacterium]|nr:ImmA/IrrE family metallo-endopeptidase [Saprospiraceae bacterium]